jgi:hypothetical protein
MYICLSNKRLLKKYCEKKTRTAGFTICITNYLCLSLTFFPQHLSLRQVYIFLINLKFEISLYTKLDLFEEEIPPNLGLVASFKANQAPGF